MYMMTVRVAVGYEVHACGFHIGGGATYTRHLVHGPLVSLPDASVLL